MLNDHQIELAKKRIWSRLESKLPERGIGVFQPVLSLLRSSEKPSLSRLKQVQMKERFLDLLPDRSQPIPFFSRRIFASSALVLVLGVLFMPVLEVAPNVSAASANVLEVVEGEVWVNGTLTTNTTLIQPGDTILTGENSMAHLYFLDDSRVTLGADTQVDIVDTTIDPENRAKTMVELRQESGRLWVQVLNLVSKESFFVLDFPNGEVTVDSRASFDVQVGDETQISVARNLVTVNATGEDNSYEGVLGQGASLWAGDELRTEAIDREEEADAWWSFNLTYGKSYARQLDENYKQEAIDRAVILPGNPFYFLKTFRETLQVTFTFSSEAKEDLLVQQAENRLNEAQVLLAQGKTDAAEETLQVYQDTVEKTLENSDNVELLAALQETQKQVSVNQDVDVNLTLFQDHLTSSSALVSSDVSDKTEVKLDSASQKLQRVPDLLVNGDFDQALLDLSAYQLESFSIVTELENVALDQREAIVSALLDQKLKDIQMLRVIASMPELTSSVDTTDTMLEQLSMLLLSLREKELTQLSEFFESTDYNVTLQYQIYSRLRDQADITPELTQQFQNTEVVMDIQEVETVPEPEEPSETPVVDPRF